MVYGISLVTAPSEEPFNTSTAKAHLRVEHSDDDDLIDSLITAARIHAEQFTRRAFITQTWDLFLDSFPWLIYFPLPPLQSVTTVKYTDVDGVQQTLALANYQLDSKSLRARLAPAFDKSWPDTRAVLNAVEIRFVTGYGAAVAVPAAIVAAIKLIMTDLYEHRSEFVIGATVNPIPLTAQRLLWPYRAMESP